MFGWYGPFAVPLIALPIAGLIVWKLDVPQKESALSADGELSAHAPWAVLCQPAVVGLLLASVVNFVLLFVSSASISNGLAATQIERMARQVAQRWLVAGAFVLSAAALAIIPLVTSLEGVVQRLPLSTGQCRIFRLFRCFITGWMTSGRRR